MNTFEKRRLLSPTCTAAVLLVVLATAVWGEEPSEYVIGIEDVLQISMPDHPELGATVPVRPDGRISLPLIDDVTAAGLTPVQLKERLTVAYRGFVTVPNITVMVSEIHSLKVYVLGEVSSPGEFDVQRPVRILQAIALAGGFTEFADKNSVVLLREQDDKQVRLEVNLKRVYSGEDISLNYFLLPGDTLVVP